MHMGAKLTRDGSVMVTFKCQVGWVLMLIYLVSIIQMFPCKWGFFCMRLTFKVADVEYSRSSLIL
jgi:hypothetical protein